MIVDIVGYMNSFDCFGYVMIILYFFNKEIKEREYQYF